ncbi:MAG: flavodoxin domain-containing protein [Candidatus Omnitrophica bacterium]|nr:flavodoxin domain-containing protein [Candidatus Omnitrophota bacterium]
MNKVLVIYYSKSGNTKKLAEIFTEGLKNEGVGFDLKDVGSVKADDLLKYGGIAIGSPTYYGTMAWQIKQLFDESVKFHGKLDGKAGCAFSSSHNVAGGNETTIVDMLCAMLIHGMIIQGDPQGDHYGTASIGAPDARASKMCKRQGERFARLVKTLNTKL